MKNTKLMELLNQSDPKVKSVVYSAIGMVLAEKMLINTNDRNVARIKATDALDMIAELGIVDYDSLKNKVISMINIVVENRTINLVQKGLTSSKFEDMFSYPSYLTSVDVDNINDNMLMYKSALSAFSAWYTESIGN